MAASELLYRLSAGASVHRRSSDYRELAAQCMASAQEAEGERRKELLLLASQWLLIADSAEACERISQGADATFPGESPSSI
jgi:hypothetical protein